MTTDDLDERSCEQPSRAARLGSKDPYAVQSIGLVGTGYIAEYHAKALRVTPGVRLDAVCDRSLSRARSFAATFDVEAIYGSLDDMLASRRLDAVHVLTPPDAHFLPTQQLLKTGVAVLLEKPMSISIDECDRLQALSDEKNVRLGIAHNFLFAEPYEEFRRDLRRDAFGPIDHISITWHKPLGQLVAGPFDLWMLRDPTNILFEIGPHPFGQLLDMVGQPDAVDVVASNDIELPTGVPFYRRWHVHARRGKTAVDLDLSFVGGFSEHWIHVRGTTGSATVDFEKNTYLRHRHVPREIDFDRYAMLRNESKALSTQARRTLLGYVSSKVRASARGNPYGYSIAKAVESFYGPPAGGVDSRLSAKMGRDVIALCERIRDSLPVRTRVDTPKISSASTTDSTAASVLVLGATGFIGKELVRQLVAMGRPTRVLVRSASKLPNDLVSKGIQVVEGDCGNARDLDAALEGIESVIHLARSNVKTWSDYQKHEIEMTRLVGERALVSGVRRFIYSGTIDSYYAGPGAGTITEVTPLDQRIERRNLYARAKAVSEELLATMHRDRNLPLLIFRPGIVIGRGGSPLHWGVGMWQHGTICQLWGDGDNKLPFVLVDDVARGIIAGIDAPAELQGESFNLIGEPCLSGNDYLDELERLASMKIQRFHTPISTFYAVAMLKWVVKVMVRHPEHIMPSYHDWASRSQMAVFDCSKAKKLLGWQPETDRAQLIERGLGEPVREWFR